MGANCADFCRVEDPPTFLFADDELVRAQAIVHRGWWIDYAGREYVVTHMTEGLPDPSHPGVKEWVVWGYRKLAGTIVSGLAD